VIYIIIDKRTIGVLLVAMAIVAMLIVSISPANAVTKEQKKIKNVIIFVGDGMGASTVTAARWYSTQNSMGGLYIDTMPYTAVIKTDSANCIVTDSAPAATSIFTGKKTNNGMINWYNNETYTTILEDAKKAGKMTGIVSTTRITHATPAGCYAKTNNRDDEITIAKQLYDSDIDVIMGGGRQFFFNNITQDPETGKTGKRTDMDLIKEFWLKGYKYVYSEKQFKSIDPAYHTKVLALFEPSHMQYEADRSSDKAGEPGLEAMTEKAIEILEKDNDGYFLMVEGGRIDHASHEAKPYKTIMDTLAFDAAIKKAASMVDLNETLIIVCADHSHTMTINGYPSIDTPILGTTLSDAAYTPGGKSLPFPVISYGTGNKAYNASEWANAKVDKELVYPGACLIGEETHGGEDTHAYALGAGSEKLHGTMHLTGLYEIAHAALF
jgi:alkaline phosphatase